MLFNFRIFASAGSKDLTAPKTTKVTQTSDAMPEPQSSMGPEGPYVNVFPTEYGEHGVFRLNYCFSTSYYLPH